MLSTPTHTTSEKQYSNHHNTNTPDVSPESSKSYFSPEQKNIKTHKNISLAQNPSTRSTPDVMLSHGPPFGSDNGANNTTTTRGDTQSQTPSPGAAPAPRPSPRTPLAAAALTETQPPTPNPGPASGPVSSPGTGHSQTAPHSPGSDTSDTMEAHSRPGYTSDASLADHLIGLPVLKHHEFVDAKGRVTLVKGKPKLAPYAGKVTSHRQFFQDGGLVHVVCWSDGMESELSLSEVQEAHQLHSETVEGCARTPLELRPHPLSTVAARAPAVGHPPRRTVQPIEVDFPAPASYASYLLRVPHEGTLVDAKIERRTITNGSITWYLRLTPKTGGPSFVVPYAHHRIVSLISLYKRESIRPPAACPPKVLASRGAWTPSEAGGWSRDHPAIGLQGLVTIGNLDLLPTPAARKGGRKPRYKVVVVAANTNSEISTTYFCSIAQQPDLFVLLDDSQILAEAVHASEVASFSKRRDKKRSLNVMVDRPGSDAFPVLGRAALHEKLMEFANALPDNEKEFFGLGFAVANCKIPARARRHFRRCYDAVLDLALTRGGAGTKLLLILDALLMVPHLPEGVSRTADVTDRCRRFLKGDLQSLLGRTRLDDDPDDPVSGPERLKKSSSHRPKPCHPLTDPLDRAAANAQYDLTERGSVKSAASKLSKLPAPLPTARGVLTDTMKKLHPQAGSRRPPHPPMLMHGFRPVSDLPFTCILTPRHQRLCREGGLRVISLEEEGGFSHRFSLLDRGMESMQGGGDIQPRLHAEPLLRSRLIVPAAPAPSLVASAEAIKRANEAALPSSSEAPPATAPPAPPPMAPVSSQIFSTKELIDACRRRDPAKAPGPCGLSFLHMRTLFAVDDSLATKLTAYLNLIVADRLDEVSRNLVVASRCVAVPKPKGGVRPIAVGCSLLRLVQAASLSKQRDAIIKYLYPLQYGVGVRSGLELMTHTIKAHLELNPGHLVIASDAENAFNSWDRGKLWPVLDEHLPALSNLTRFSYAKPSVCLFAEPDGPAEAIESTVGSRQGCGLGSLTYCLALQPAVQQLQTEFPDALILTYVDDLHIVAEPKRAAACYQRWREIYHRWMEGRLRADKSKSFSLGAPTVLDPSPTATTGDLCAAALRDLDITVPHSVQGIEVLGSPIGTAGYVESFVSKKVDDVVDSMDVLARATLAHARHTILQKSLAHKLAHIQRSVPTGDIGTQLFADCRRLDLRMRDLVQQFVPGSFLNDTAWELATLPLRLGGLGYSAMQHCGDAAFIAGYQTARATTDVYPHLKKAFPDITKQSAQTITPISLAARRAFVRLHGQLGPGVDLAKLANGTTNADGTGNRGTTTKPTERARTIQSGITLALHDLRHQRLLQRLPERHKAEHHSCAGDAFGFQAMPTEPALRLTNEDFQISIARRLLLPLTCNCDSHRCPICHSEAKKVDRFGDHALCCFKDGNRPRTHAWHDPVYGTWHQMFKAAGFSSVSDDAHKCSNALMSDSEKRPDILLRNRHPGGADIFVDLITCVPGKADIVAKAAATPGAAAAAGHAKKYNAWHAHCIAQGDVIIPLAMETGGRICEGGASLLDDAANATGGTKGEKLAFLTYWRQRIAISNLKGVARAIAKRIPICTGDHFPISFQRFTTIDMGPTPSPALSACDAPSLNVVTGTADAVATPAAAATATSATPTAPAAPMTAPVPTPTTSAPTPPSAQTPTPAPAPEPKSRDGSTERNVNLVAA